MMKKTIITSMLMVLPLWASAQLFDSSTETTKAQTQYGQVAGYIESGVYTYKGIPYAQAERFMPAKEPKSWPSIRSCRHWGTVCPQGKNNGWRHDETAFFYQWNDGYQDEDCLRLNIWTKGLNDGKKRPVLFWLHGGGYTSGNGQEHPGYDGSERISNDIPLLIGSTLNELSTPKEDESVRPAVIRQTTIRCEDGGAPVYVYLSAYQSPTMDGRNHACHNSDIPFFFNNVVKSAQMTGATKEAIALGDKMSNALLNFARTGNPNAKGLPHWPGFTPETEATMRFDAPKSTVTTQKAPKKQP